MDDATAWVLEERFWLDDDAQVLAAVDPECIMAFPAPTGLLAGPSIAWSLAGAVRWSSVQMTERRVARPGPGVLVLGYRARGERKGARPYEAFCTSTYRATEHGWMLVQHQQTPVR